MLTITLIGSSALLAYSIFPKSLKTQSCSKFFLLLFTTICKGEWTDSPQELSIPDPPQKGLYPKVLPTFHDRKAAEVNKSSKQGRNEVIDQPWNGNNDLAIHRALTQTSTVIKRNIGSSSSKYGLAALVNKWDNLGRDMEKLKENVHAIQVGCQICEGPHLDKDCPLNEEVKQVEEIDNRPSYDEKRQSLEELLAKHQEESARRSTEMEGWIKRLQENAEINTRNLSASLKNLETQIEQLSKEIHSDKILYSSSEQIKTVTSDQETSGLNKLHGMSFISGLESNTPEVLQHQLPPKELNPGSFTLPCTIGKFNFYAMADLGASINVMPRSIFEHLHLTNLKKTNMLCEMADMSKEAPLGIVENILVKIDKFLSLLIL
ncbi:reverse transcriptase domain-containing protein [Tanacetum coccineum]